MAKYKTIETICSVCGRDDSKFKHSNGKTSHIIRVVGDHGFDVAICTVCGNIKEANLIEGLNLDKVKKT